MVLTWGCSGKRLFLMSVRSLWLREKVYYRFYLDELYPGRGLYRFSRCF
jgi:hypothetical protein